MNSLSLNLLNGPKSATNDAEAERLYSLLTNTPTPLIDLSTYDVAEAAG